MSGLIATIERRPQAAFVVFLALHALVWTALPTLLYLNLPLDLIEALTYGREWQLGYDKLPPLPWWLIEIVYRMVGVDAAYYALAQATVIAAYAAVWAMARKLVGGVGALVAIMITDGLHFFHFTAVKFNHDVVQLPLWALAGYAYWAALRGGRMLHWILLGVAVGLALWAKYFVVVLAVPLALFLVLDRDARKSLATPGPWVALAVAAAVMAPHIVWLVQNDFLPFAYAEHRARPFQQPLDYVIQPPKFLLLQLGFLLPSLLIASPYLRQDVGPVDPAPPHGDAFDRRIVRLLTFGPVAMVVLMTIVSGRIPLSMWGYPLWLFFGLWGVQRGRALERRTLTRIVVLWGLTFTGYAAAFVIQYTVIPRYDQHYRATLFPGRELGLEMSRRYRAMTGRPLAYVIGSMWDGGNVSHYAPERPRVLIDGKPSRAPWIDLGDLRSRGAVVLWTDGGDPKVLPPAFRAIAADAEIQPPFWLPFQVGGPVVEVGWAVLRPRPVIAVSSPP
jgi:4-amino-4-deoxy-L-arabinose transferase-like glycosyltransferase